MPAGPLAEVARLWSRRDLLSLLVAADLKLRYKGSALGFVWGLLNPLLLTGIFALVFTHLLRPPVERFPLFLLSALFPWTFVAQATVRATQSVVQHGTLLRKVAVPASVFPLASSLSSLANFALSLPVLLGLALLLRAPVTVAWLYLPVAGALLFAFVAGVALLVSAANVFFRDVQHLVEVLLSMAFYLTPIIYSLEMLPPAIAGALVWNPIAPLLLGFRDPLYAGAWPDPRDVAAAAASAAAALAVGWTFFQRCRPRFFLYV
ncbi:MAG: ABC transporter permease [Planctomycetales bacterium]|nr:ABC transporter permease [Planctomycetales bacterium]